MVHRGGASNRRLPPSMELWDVSSIPTREAMITLRVKHSRMDRGGPSVQRGSIMDMPYHHHDAWVNGAEDLMSFFALERLEETQKRGSGTQKLRLRTLASDIPLRGLLTLWFFQSRFPPEEHRSELLASSLPGVSLHES